MLYNSGDLERSGRGKESRFQEVFTALSMWIPSTFLRNTSKGFESF
jgi:hypothetical protein